MLFCRMANSRPTHSCRQSLTASRFRRLVGGLLLTKPFVLPVPPRKKCRPGGAAFLRFRRLRTFAASVGVAGFPRILLVVLGELAPGVLLRQHGAQIGHVAWA